MSDASAPALQADSLDIHGIMKRIPHRFPFLMIERVTNIVLGESATGIKNVSVNEPHFQGHFPGEPVMPGVLIVEAMAQTAAVLVMESIGETEHGRIVYFMTIENARFRRPVRPGDRLEIHVKKQHNRGQVWKFSGEARVDDKVVAQASYSAMIVDNTQ
ncbi:MAG: 3-hydroxyacyl-ACP dehydratase FabZ [Rhodospirillales bacterium]